ncbi:gag-protease polyprotein [Cucumis melo var. makuwa]|uniref:Gag-protease polyprotein n=1 Tax=Cucumis melo var. makuwa TaxID=1194695 RepID=A0A5D3B8M4_CUCMM|nr:gag-protease polyprotein [Cucumis melo var. makuwa]
MPPRRGARRGGGRGGTGVKRTQLEEQPTVKAANPTAPVTQADLTTMEQRYQNMLQAALAPFLAAQQTQAAPAQAQTVPPPAPVEARLVSDQLSAEAKHLRDFKKYNHKTFDGSMDNHQGPDVVDLYRENLQYDAEFDMLSRFAPDVVKDEEARIEKFVRGLRLDLQGIVRVLRPTTHADALRLALGLSLHERADPSKAADRGSGL